MTVILKHSRHFITDTLMLRLFQINHVIACKEAVEVFLYLSEYENLHYIKKEPNTVTSPS